MTWRWQRSHGDFAVSLLLRCRGLLTAVTGFASHAWLGGLVSDPVLDFISMVYSTCKALNTRSQCEYWRGRWGLTGRPRPHLAQLPTHFCGPSHPPKPVTISFFFNRAFQRQGMSPRKASFLQLLANARVWKFWVFRHMFPSCGRSHRDLESTSWIMPLCSIICHIPGTLGLGWECTKCRPNAKPSFVANTLQGTRSWNWLQFGIVKVQAEDLFEFRRTTPVYPQDWWRWSCKVGCELNKQCLRRQDGDPVSALWRCMVGPGKDQEERYREQRWTWFLRY